MSNYNELNDYINSNLIYYENSYEKNITEFNKLNDLLNKITLTDSFIKEIIDSNDILRSILLSIKNRMVLLRLNKKYIKILIKNDTLIRFLDFIEDNDNIIEEVEHNDNGFFNNSYFFYKSDIINNYIPPLTQNENIALYPFINKDQEIRNIFILSCSNLCNSIVKKYTNYGIDEEDLLQEGFLALINSLETFDPTKSKFSTYAYKNISFKMSRLIENQGQSVRRPVYVHAIIKHIHQVVDEYSNKLGKNLSLEDISNLTGINIKKLELIIINESKDVSLDEYCDSNKIVSFKDNTRDDSFDMINYIDEKASIEYFLNILEPYEKELIIRHYFNGDTIQMIANEKGQSFQNIYRIIKRVLIKLKNKMLFEEMLVNNNIKAKRN